MHRPPLEPPGFTAQLLAGVAVPSSGPGNGPPLNVRRERRGKGWRERCPGRGSLGKDVSVLWSPARVRTRSAPRGGDARVRPQSPGSQGLCLPFLQGHPLGLWDPSFLEVLGDPRIKHEIRQLKMQSQGSARLPGEDRGGVGSRAGAHPRASAPDFHPGALRGLPAPPRTPIQVTGNKTGHSPRGLQGQAAPPGASPGRDKESV